MYKIGTKHIYNGKEVTITKVFKDKSIIRFKGSNIEGCAPISYFKKHLTIPTPTISKPKKTNMYKIGTQVTYNKVKQIIIGYKKNCEDIWYKIKGVDNTSKHYTVTSGKHFTNIIPKKTLEITSVPVPTVSISTKYKTPDELKSVYTPTTPTIKSKQSIGIIGMLIIGYIIYKVIK